MSKKNETFCSICGFVIPIHHIGVKIEFDGFSFITGHPVDGGLTICNECWDKVLTIDEGGMPKAIKRSKKLVATNE